nr:MAG TPA: hypothetical protein [Caudoviricetes sp.]
MKEEAEWSRFSGLVGQAEEAPRVSRYPRIHWWGVVRP